MERQQQSLFDVSIIKLQQEQLRHGVEPRLLRFVLINNALRCLQGHMLQLDSTVGGGGGEGEDGLVEFRCESSDVFFYNTFKNGSLSPLPLSPPTPVKMAKMDTSGGAGGGISNQSPLVEYQEAIMSSSTCAASSHDMLTTADGGDRVQPAACYEEVSSEGAMGDCDCGGGVGGVNTIGSGGGKDGGMQNGYSQLGKRSTRDWNGDVQGDDEGGGGGGSIGGGKENSGCRPMELGIGGVSNDLCPGEAKRKPPHLIISSTVQKVQSSLTSLSSLNSFLDLDPFPSLPFPPSPPSPTSSPPSSLQLTPHYHCPSHYAPSEDSTDKDSLTPSPIDFTNVDPTLYDFDTAVLQVESTETIPSVGAPKQEAGSLSSVVDPRQETGSLSPSDALQQLPSSDATTTLSPAATTTSITTSLPTLHPVTTLLSTTTMTTTATTTSPAAAAVSSSALAAASLSQYPLVSSLAMTPTSSALFPPRDMDTDFEESAKPHLELEKRSVVANSMVLTTGGGASAKKGSCSMEALVRAQNGELVLEDEDRSSQDGVSMVGESGGRGMPSSPERGVVVEPDCMDEIEHIVKLLMT